MIKLFAMDVDGTLTDGKIHIGGNGEIFKSFNSKDGYALRELLPTHGIVPIIITGRQSQIVENRAHELGISEIHQGVKDKATKLLEIAEKYNCTRDHIAYIGDDDNDLTAMNLSKLVGCPDDASGNVKKIANFVSQRNGGCGAIREFAEWIINFHEDE